MDLHLLGYAPTTDKPAPSISFCQWQKLALDRLPVHLKGGDWDAERLPPEGLLPPNLAPGAAHSAASIWHMLDVRYMGTPGDCEALGPRRDLGPDYFTLHFACMPTGLVHPTEATTEEAFFSQVRARKRGFFVSNCSQCTEACNYPALPLLAGCGCCTVSAILFASMV